MSASSPSPLSAWVIASRPKTLFASISPVLLGTALAYSRGLGDGVAACLAFLGAIFIQIGTNLANDYWDAKKGADRADRLGPRRAARFTGGDNGEPASPQRLGQHPRLGGLARPLPALEGDQPAGRGAHENSPATALMIRSNGPATPTATAA